MTHVTKILAQTVFELVRRGFEDSGQPDRKAFRIKNLRRDESMAFLALWQLKAGSAGLDAVRVVIANDADQEFPEEFRADPAHSITYYRNNNNHGLVYIETKVESDEQGLKNLYTLQDGNYLDGTFDADGFRVPGLMVERAATLAGVNGIGPGSVLWQRLLDVLDLLKREDAPVPLRMFIEFAYACCVSFARAGRALDASEIDVLVGQELHVLGMFPDPRWREVETRAGRRLRLNMLRSELASSPSSDHDPDDLANKATRTEFKNPDGSSLPEAKQRAWQQACRRYCLEPVEALRREIPYPIFEQIFEKDVTGMKLGDRVSAEIGAEDRERLPELERLGVVPGLNRRSVDDAQRFLDAEADRADQAPLRGLLTPPTLRMVERAARPSVRKISNPVVELASGVQELRKRNEAVSDTLRAELRLARGTNPAAPSVGLLAFLYGSTFSALEVDSGSGADEYAFKADDALKRIVAPPAPVDDVDEASSAEERTEIVWDPVDLEIVLINSSTSTEVDSVPAFRWYPDDIEYLALFWISVCGQDCGEVDQILGVPDATDTDEWLEGVVSRRIALDGPGAQRVPASATGREFVRRYVSLRREFRNLACTDGISISHLANFCDGWRDVLSEARTSVVPDGMEDPGLSAFLYLDHVLNFGGGLLMLPSHPIRLRWIARYLQTSERFARDALAGSLNLNSQNPQFYSEWIDRLSPHRQPAVHASRGEHRYLLADGERGWSEHFSALEATEETVLETGHSDPAIVREISQQVGRYLHAHPYKSSGLSLAVVLNEASDLPLELARQIRAESVAHLPISLWIVAPKAAWLSMKRSLEALATRSRIAAGATYLPDFELRFVDLSQGARPTDLLADLACDIAIIPEFLREGAATRENTEKPGQLSGEFDPLLATPTYVYGGAGGGDISVSLRPRPADPLIADWCTLLVRHSRRGAVAPDSLENFDFVDLRINFGRASEFFAAVHEIAHWVITVERHISRQQIESLPSKPEIVTIRERVGPAGLYTLVVSSNSGRRLMIERLTRKLERLVARRTAGSPSGKELPALAERLYNETRQVAPRLMLEALGISRVTEEIIGLAVGRRQVTERFGTPTPGAIAVWVALDEYQEWFGGASGTRADMIRLSLVRIEDRLIVDLVVLEGKLRQLYDTHGTEQTRRTLDLMREILKPDREPPPIDTRLWRQNLLAALENAGTGAREGPMSTDGADGDRHLVPDDVRDDFIKGNFDLRSCDGLYSICLYEQDGPPAIEHWPADPRVMIVRSSCDEVFRIGQDTVATPTPQVPQAPTAKSAVPVQAAPAEPGAPIVDMVPADPIPTAIAAPASPAATAPTEPAMHRENPERRGGLGAEKLRQTYQTILDTLAVHKVGVLRAEDGVEPAIEGPASVLYRIRPAMGVEAKRIIEKGDALKLALRLSQEHEIRFSLDRGHISIEVPKHDSERYFVAASDLWGRWSRPEKGLAVPLGEDNFGDIVQLDFSSANAPHLLIGGTTGSGKSEALNTILGGIVKYYSKDEARLLLIDPKGTELTHLEKDPHLEGNIGWEDQDAVALLERAVIEMQRRYELFRSKSVRSLQQYNDTVAQAERIPWWVVVLDEYADLTSDPDAKKTIEASLKRLAQKARAAGIHVIIATQKPSAEVISTNLRSNLPAQLALRVKSGTESRVIMDEQGAETLAGKGDAFLKAEGRVVRVQCAKI